MRDYPRDMVGYGEYPVNPHWPEGARLAVQFVINYEEGGENCILHGDTASEAFLSEIVGASPLVGVRHMNMESIYPTFRTSLSSIVVVYKFIAKGTHSGNKHPCFSDNTFYSTD